MTSISDRPLAHTGSTELRASPGSTVVPAAFSDRRAVTLLVADGLVIVAIIADMVLKPF